MNQLLKMVLFPFFDQIVDVGIEKWTLMTLFFGGITYATWGGSILPFLGIASLILTINVAIFGLGIAVWWKYHGKEKHEMNLVDLADQMTGREK